MSDAVSDPSPSPSVIDDTAQPAPPPPQKDRIRLLDAARGLGVLGILPCNMPDFDFPLGVGESVQHWPLGHSPGSLAGWAVTQMFFQRRFVTLFSMLFGVSVFLVGGERSDKDRGLILRKRLFALLAIGLVHNFAVWWGDVLVTYALCGFILIFMRSFSPRRLLIVGGIWWLAVTALMGLAMVMQFHPRAPHPDEAKQAAQAAATIAQYQGGFLSSLLANAKDGVNAQTGQPFIVLFLLPPMLMGLAAYKLGVFTGEARAPVYWVLLAGGAGALGVVVVSYGVYLMTGLDKPSRAAGDWAQQALAPVMSLGYVAVLVFAMRSKLWRFVTDALAPVGQMAFTNYLTQSLMMTALFYGGRGPDLYGRIDRPGLWAICIAVWVLQIIWSRLWLSYFTMGPLEWCWRRLYRGPAPLRRRPGLTAATA